MSFFYAFPSELIRLALQDNSICLEYPRDRLYSSILIFYFASTCLFFLATFAFHGSTVQLLVIHFDILVFLLLQLVLLQKGLQWAQCFISIAESTFAMTDTIRRDSMRRRSNEAFARQETISNRRQYEHSQLRKEPHQNTTIRKRNDDSEPHSIDIDINKLNSALQNGSLFG